MVLLNLFSRTYNLPLFLNGKSFFLLLCITSHLQGEIIPFFNPTSTYKKNEATISVQGFIANDPVSIKDFFDDWEGSYSPESGDNIAIEELRVDIGTLVYDKYYIGYFYDRNMLGRTNRDFADAFHAIKNDLEFNTQQHYDLELELEGIEEHGLMISRNIPLIDTDDHHIILGASAYLSYTTDVQKGSLSGNGSISTDQTYSATASTDYYYMNNLLYDLDVIETSGIGYGLHLGLFYENKSYGFDIQLIANNLLSRSHWKNLPFSHVDIETSNQEINDDGHIEYNPTISGLEVYRDYTQHITPKYHLDVKKHFSHQIDLKAGIDIIDNVEIPYISVAKTWNKTQKVELIYEHRFKSKGIKYQDENFSLSVMSDGFNRASVLGISGSYIYRF